MVLEIRELCKRDSVIDDDWVAWSRELSMVEPHLEKTPFKELCGDDAMVSVTPSIEHVDSMCTQPLELTPISSPLLYSIPSHFACIS